MKRFYKLLILLIIFTKVIYAQLTPSIDWFQIYDGIGHSVDIANDAKIDNENNFYLAGRSAGIDGSQDLLILKYSPNGELISEIRYISALSSWEEANSIVIDSSNNLYCIGSASFGTSSFFTVIQKYSPNGTLIWDKNFYNTSQENSEGRKITVDNDNNVIAGYHLNGASLTKYTSVGDSLWTIKVADDTSYYAIDDILTDANSNIYVAITQSFDGGSDISFTLIHSYKYNKNGILIWHKTFNGIYTKKIVLDKNKDILLLIINPNGGAIIKMNQDGEIKWEKDSAILILTDLGIDNDNNIIVTGYDVTNNSFDYYTKKYSPDGIDIWLQIFNSTENLKDFASALAVDNFNNIFVTGSSHNSVSQGISYTVKYSDSGELLWQQKFNAPHSIFENTNFLFLDDSNNVFVGGDVADSTNSWNFLVMKIKQKIATGLKQIDNNLPVKYSLMQNYPNPFNPSTQIMFKLPEESFVRINIYNLLGQKIKTLINGYMKAGTYNTVWYGKDDFGNNVASGIYIYRFTTGKYIISKKMTLMK